MSSSPSIATKWVVRLLAGGLDRKTRSTAPASEVHVPRAEGNPTRAKHHRTVQPRSRVTRVGEISAQPALRPITQHMAKLDLHAAMVASLGLGQFLGRDERGDHALGDLVGDFDCVAARPVLSARPGRDVSTRGSRLRCAAGRASRRSLAAIAVGAAGRCEWRRCRDGRARNPRARAYTIIARTRRNLRARSAKCLSTPWSSSLAPPYSITSSARARSVAGTSRPSDLAVLRLITNSYLVGACTGRSAGFSPLRMRST